MVNSAYSHIQHLAHAVFFDHDPKQRYFAIMTGYTVYLDASGDAGCEMIGVGGFIASVDQWEAFESEWLGVLNWAKVSHFHKKMFTAKLPPFDDPKWKEESYCAEFMSRLCKAIYKNVRFQILNLLRMSDWRQVNLEYCLEESKWSPYAISGVSAIDASFVWAERNNIPPSHMEFYFESGDVGHGDLVHHCLNRYGFQPGFKPKCPDALFPHAKELTPLQAGDLVAGYNRTAELAITSMANPDDYRIRKCLDVLLDNVPGHDDGELWPLQGLRNFFEKENIPKR
jgi:hypothetical protein